MFGLAHLERSNCDLDMAGHMFKSKREPEKYIMIQKDSSSGIADKRTPRGITSKAEFDWHFTINVERHCIDV